jgi:hypothetical protein
MTGNNSKDSLIYEQRSNFAIGRVWFCFKRVGRRKKEETIGKWSQILSLKILSK